ncbi:MAG: hypothetical protein K2G39_01325, partial [Lachnospiraceae bacterium]|nr:hypothetical protein [Lachnospiraceae bacterium]
LTLRDCFRPDGGCCFVGHAAAAFYIAILSHFLLTKSQQDCYYYTEQRRSYCSRRMPMLV